jgi:PhnB protein
MSSARTIRLSWEPLITTPIQEDSMAFHPYLNFGGNCREAFTRYQEIFGGELFLLPMSDMPTDQPLPPEQADLMAHAALTFDGHLLMGSDDPVDEFGPVHGMHVNFTTADAADAERIFTELLDGGEVRMPFGETPWSPAFGMCVDRFGTPWMVDVEPTPEQAGQYLGADTASDASVPSGGR